MVPLFQNFRVSLVLSGNSHNYERTFPLIDGRPVPGDGVTYIVTGAGGNLFTRFAAPVPAYSAFREDTSYEFVKVTVGPKELVAQAVSDDGRTIIDRTTIKRRKNDTTPPTGPTGVVAARPTLRGRLPQLESQYGRCRSHRLSDLPGRRSETIATVSAPGFTQTTLDPSTTYRYTVRAVDAAGNRSAASPVAVASPPDNGVFDLNGAQRSGAPQATAAGSNHGKTGCASSDTPVPLPAGKQAAPSAFAFRRRPTRQPAPRRGPAGRTD